LIQHGVQKLLALFPSRGISPAEQDEFNRDLADNYDPVRDFIILHYHANERPEPFWQRMRAMEIPDTLRHKLELFREHGRVFRYNEELFDVPSWIAVMLGQGVIPKSYDPLVDAMPEREVLQAMAELARGYEERAEQLPLASDYVERRVGG
jgi:tryptophan halogenase